MVNPDFSEGYTLELSPNPVSDVLRVQLLSIDQATQSHPVNIQQPNPLTGTVQILDLAGRVVLEQQGLRFSGVELDLKTLAPGAYFVVLQSEGKRAMGHFVKL